MSRLLKAAKDHHFATKLMAMNVRPSNPKQWTYNKLNKMSSLGDSTSADKAIEYRGIEETFDVSKIHWYQDPSEVKTDVRNTPHEWQWKENSRWKRTVLNPWGWVDGHGFAAEAVPHYVDMVTQRMADAPNIVPEHHGDYIVCNGPRPRPFGQYGTEAEAKRHPKKIIKMSPSGVGVCRWCQTKWVKKGFFERNDPKKLRLDPFYDREDPLPGQPTRIRNRGEKPRAKLQRQLSSPTTLTLDT